MNVTGETTYRIAPLGSARPGAVYAGDPIQAVPMVNEDTGEIWMCIDGPGGAAAAPAARHTQEGVGRVR